MIPLFFFYCSICQIVAIIAMNHSLAARDLVKNTAQTANTACAVKSVHLCDDSNSYLVLFYLGLLANYPS